MLQLITDNRATSSDMGALDRFVARVALSPDGTILRTNARFLELFDYSAWDLAGRSRSILLPHDGEEDGEDGVRQAFTQGLSYTGEVRRCKRDGTPFWAEATYVPMRDEAGELQEVVVFLRDISDRRARTADEGGQISAINVSQAVIHFTLDGTILDANPLFLDATGYRLDEIVGRHHRMFVEEGEAAGADYEAFWTRLRAGHHGAGEYRRLGRDRRLVWLRATYNPILDVRGRPFKVVKYATDVTTEKLRQADHDGQIAAIHKSQCVVSFAMDGTITDANENFLRAVGYRFEEIEGRHHRMFVDPSHAHSLEYEIFWSELCAGRHQTGEFRRRAKDGSELWLQATYNPVFDLNGKPFKVMKYATFITREKLRQADHQGQIAAMHKSQAVVSFALDGTILDANDNFLQLTGYPLSQVRGRHHRMFVPDAEQAGDDYPSFWRKLAAGEHQSGEFKRICRDGREVWIQASYNPIFDMNGRPFKVVKNAIDVTAQKLRQSDHEGQIAAIRKSQCVVSFDMDGTLLDANANFLDAMGYERHEIIGRHHSMFVDPSFAESDQYRQFWEGLRSGSFLSSKFRRTAKDGRDVWIQASYNPIFDLNGRPFKVVKIATDITADVALADNLTKAKREVLQDRLTGLPNRLGLSHFMHEALREPDGTLSVLYLDLDHFKPINDTFGHHVGDHVLREIAARLRLTLAADQLGARVGGDEFVVVAPNLSREAAGALAEQLIAAVRDPIRHEKTSLSVGLSIGIAQAPVDSVDADELLRHADVALYRSKGGHRGTHTFFSDGAPGDESEANRHLADEMQFGIKAEQFALFFRPRFTAEDRVLTAVEAQVEWNHPDRGQLRAPAFMPLAESSGLVVPLGDWILRAACSAAAQWPLVTVGVPISSVQLFSSDLPGAVALALRETGLPPARLELQIARGLGRFDLERIRADLTTLRNMGVRVVVEGQVVGEDLTSGREGWPVDYVAIDPKTRSDLTRLGHASVAEIVRLETALGLGTGTPDEEASIRDLLSLRLDRNAKLEAFLNAEARSADAIRLLLLESA
ncbi:PAS domain S-box protein [Aureimonas pseudogalii]|uniref:Diguanylate cyclase (GGDEF)-like protein/PAS domain S-box-containing protein n=1 Tax=Aureimonas pseudogalii TaxID=1744844 RepID=A0A7W6H656_9HYPH|nr:PAS domain S-box protein [Aureimonas pseudogalii]MBB3999271.1 diguanylate cyclase (GGDEF)-like protein/PAS domain S-box-containing protein [Aureimonas pseudogalii]